MIHRQALCSAPKIRFFTSPFVTLGYGAFDFHVEEAFHPGSLALASITSGCCEIKDSPRSAPELSAKQLFAKREVSKWDFAADDVTGFFPLAELLEPTEAERYARLRAARSSTDRDTSWSELLAG